MLDRTIDTTALEALPFIERVPVGVYTFALLHPGPDGENTRRYEVLVYDNLKNAYNDFIQSLPLFFEEEGYSEKEALQEEEVTLLTKKAEAAFFTGVPQAPGYKIQDIAAILQYYAQKDEPPAFVLLEEREQYDISSVAKTIMDQDMGRSAQKNWMEEQWDQHADSWQVFFGLNRKYFLQEVDLALRRLEYPEEYKAQAVGQPRDEKEQRAVEKLNLEEMRLHFPAYWRQLTDAVYKKARDVEGNYVCAATGFKSPYKYLFNIDHIVPISKGGLTVLENLRVMKGPENRKKSNR